MAELEAPEWLTADFLKSCLLSDEKMPQDITITKFTTEAAVPPGNNYGSVMFRVLIEYKEMLTNETHSISLIVKAPLTGGFLEQFNDSLNEIYEREPNYYNHFINETFKLCKHDIVPKFYKSPDPLIVVLEDLKSSGYIMADRHKLLDFDHCKLYVKASSKLHALSIAIRNNNPEAIASLMKENAMFTDKNSQEKMVTMTNVSLGCMIAYLEDKPLYKDYYDIIKEIKENNYLLRMYEEVMLRKKHITALVQGDPWCANMMFRYEPSGKVESIKLFDFQSVRVDSPLQELVTFVWASANLDVRENNLNDLYHLYCNSLNENLAELGCSERLSFEDMKVELMSLSPVTIFLMCGMLPICIADGAASINDFINTETLNVPIKETSVYNLYQGTAFSQFYPQVLDQADKQGIFDYLKEKVREYKSEK